MTSARLTLLAGPRAGERIDLGAAPFVGGRDRLCDLHLRDLTVSRRHFTLEPAAESYRLRDLESRHGTFVNGVPVRERTLRHGDRIAAGRTLLLYTEEQGEADEPAPPSRSLAWEDVAGAESTIHLSREAAEALRLGAPVLGVGADSGPLLALLRAARELQTLHTTEEVARRLLELALEVLPASRAALLLGNPPGDEDGATWVLSRQGGAAPFPLPLALLARVAERGQALLASDPAPTPSGATRSFLALPLPLRREPTGALYLEAEGPAPAFGRAHLELGAGIAGIAAGALESARHCEGLALDNRRLARELAGELVGESPPMRDLYRLLARVAASDATVLLRGESGTGKELAARALHAGGARAGKPFVAVNCATLSETLLESELFGHERGAFTGAIARQVGKMELADGGTLFLDEIAETPVGVQAKLLRALQEREVTRLGAARPIRVDVRLIAATHRDLERAVREGTFRDDLFYRLNVISCPLPPLRERGEDIALLASHFAARFGRKAGREVGLSPGARAALLHHPWPGNVRELANAIERAVVLGEGALIEVEDLPETMAAGAASLVAPGAEPAGGYHETVAALKRDLLAAALAAEAGSVTRAAARLGLNPTYLHRLLRQLNVRSSRE